MNNMPETPNNQNPFEEKVELHNLCDADADALDAYLANRAAGHANGPMLADAKERAERIDNLLGLLAQQPVEDAPEDLTARTMAFIEEARQRERFTEQIDMLSQPRRSLGISWKQVLSAAAVFLVGFTLLVPVLDNNRQTANKVACNANLAGMGQAIGRYASDNNLMLPSLSAKPGSTWWNVGQDKDVAENVTSNSAHLYQLARQGYLLPEDMSCPANMNAPVAGQMTGHEIDWSTPQAVSYSYQNMYSGHQQRISADPLLVIAADKNPRFKVVIRSNTLEFDASVDATANSKQHNSRGQNMLRLDGSVDWSDTPLINHPGVKRQDNIWGATGIEKYTGKETTKNAGDAFLVP